MDAISAPPPHSIFLRDKLGGCPVVEAVVTGDRDPGYGSTSKMIADRKFVRCTFLVLIGAMGAILPKGTGLMFSGKPINVIFVCSQCSLVYIGQQERRADGKGAGRFGCTGCGAMVHAWSGVYDYADWKPLELAPTKKPRPDQRAGPPPLGGGRPRR